MNNQITLSNSQTGNYQIEDYSGDNKQSFRSQAMIYVCLVGMGIGSIITGNKPDNSIPISNRKGSETFKLPSSSKSGGLNMSDKVSKDAFEEYKSGIDQRLTRIEDALIRIETNMVTSDILDSKLKNISLSIKNWILGSLLLTVLGFIAWLFAYLFPNFETFKKALEAIN